MVCVRTASKDVFGTLFHSWSRVGFLVVLSKWAKAEVAEAHVQLRYPSLKGSFSPL
jgi:hypothetical protein